MIDLIGRAKLETVEEYNEAMRQLEQVFAAAKKELQRETNSNCWQSLFLTGRKPILMNIYRPNNLGGEVKHE